MYESGSTMVPVLCRDLLTGVLVAIFPFLAK